MYIFLVVEIFLFVLYVNCKKRNEKVLFWWSCALLFMMTALHDGNGNTEYGYDFPQYMNFFQGKPSIYGNLDSGYELEPVYAYFCRFLRLFGRSDFVYILGTALFFGCPFVYLVYKFSNNKPLSILLLFTILNSSTYLTFLAAHRQMTATTLLLICFILYNTQIKYKKPLIILLALGSLMAHSSSYIVIPLFVLVYYLKVSSRKYVEWAIFVSMIIGLLFFSVMNNFFMTSMTFLSHFDELDRTTFYTLNEIYENNKVSIFRLAPISILSILCVHYSTKKEFDSIYVKSLYTATIFKNMLGFVPLINRGFLLFFLLGIIGAVPSAINTNNRFKICMTVVVIIHIIAAYRDYLAPSFRLAPFHFIFE